MGDIWTLQKDWIVVDLGAHNGEYSFDIDDKVKEVWAIEPTPESVKCMREIIEKDQITNVYVQEFAISNVDGKRTFNLYKGRDSDGNSFYENRGVFKESIEVRTKTWDTFMKENKIDHVDLVIVDIEGAEKDFFDGMTILPQRIYMLHIIVNG